MIYSNEWLIKFVGENWMALLILYGAVRAMYPDSKILNAIGEGFANLFPVFRKKGE
ncbi:MAG: hypothetical protein PHC52_06285 [Syntrophales bacterium]|jgi:hypothetical protein|nr:hypothetical protein [Syntrophales bacterium]